LYLRLIAHTEQITKNKTKKTLEKQASDDQIIESNAAKRVTSFLMYAVCITVYGLYPWQRSAG